MKYRLDISHKKIDMKSKYSIRVIPLKEKEKDDGTWPIYYVVAVASDRFRVSAKEAIHPDHWDFAKERAKRSLRNFQHLNTILYNQVDGFNDFIYKLKASKQPISVTIMKSYFKAKSGCELFDYFERQVNYFMEKAYAESTLKSYRSVLKILKEYNPKLTFADMTVSTIKKFNSYLISKRCNSLNGASVKHKNLKAILNHAINEGLMERNPYNGWPIPKEKRRRESLTIEEVLSLWHLDTSKLSTVLTLANDLFLFACFTGLRYSDVMKLTVENVKLNDLGNTLNITVTKTKEELEMPLQNFALDIINKYNELKPVDNAKKIFPTIANPTINRALKDLMILVGIKKSISFHCARHTFACLHVEIDTNLLYLMELMGHKSTKQTEIYAKADKKGLFKSSQIFSQTFNDIINHEKKAKPAHN